MNTSTTPQSQYNISIATTQPLTTTNAKSGVVTVSGDIVIDGMSLKNTLMSISDRLSILEPNKQKLEKYKALRLAYENYKTLESLLNE